MRKIISITMASILLAFGYSTLLQAANRHGEITYVAAEGAYLNAGRSDGLTTGDTLKVIRDKKKLGYVVLTQVASKSSACTPVDPSLTLKVGDRVAMPEGAEPATASSTPKAPAARALSKRPVSSGINRFRGDIRIEQFTHKDFTGSRLTWYQPGVRTRFKVQNISGTGIDLKFRHRTRLYRRTQFIITGGKRDQWTHRVYEASLTFDRDDAKSAWGAGRISVPHLRGFGLIDGGYYTRVLTSELSVGVGAGGVPDYQSSAPDFRRRKFGFYAAYNRPWAPVGDIELAAALSTEYDQGATSRDFLYLQNVVRRAGQLTFHQSAEVDLNRD